MPYIKRAEKDRAGRCPETAGELNYAITRLVRDYFRGSSRNYQTINNILGALEAAKAEFYRRVVVPYEDAKIQENGDVY